MHSSHHHSPRAHACCEQTQQKLESISILQAQAFVLHKANQQASQPVYKPKHSALQPLKQCQAPDRVRHQGAPRHSNCGCPKLLMDSALAISFPWALRRLLRGSGNAIIRARKSKGMCVGNMRREKHGCLRAYDNNISHQESQLSKMLETRFFFPCARCEKLQFFALQPATHDLHVPALPKRLVFVSVSRTEFSSARGHGVDLLSGNGLFKDSTKGKFPLDEGDFRFDPSSHWGKESGGEGQVRTSN